MKHGVRIPREVRDDWARAALVIFEAAANRRSGLLDIAVEFDVSEVTARNLVNRGRYLIGRM